MLRADQIAHLAAGEGRQPARMLARDQRVPHGAVRSRRRGRDLEAADLRRMRRNSGRLRNPVRKLARRPVDRRRGRRRQHDPRILPGQRRKRLQAPRNLKPAGDVEKRELPADPAPEGPAAAELLLRQNRGDPLALRRAAQRAADLGLCHGRIGCTAEIALSSTFYRDMVALTRIEKGHVPDVGTLDKLSRWLGEEPSRFTGVGNLQIAFKNKKAVPPKTAKALAELITKAAQKFEREVDARGH